MQKIKLFFCTMACCLPSIIHAQPLVFDSQSSAFKVASGATLSVAAPLSNYTGTLVRDSGAAIVGSVIDFVDGVFIDEHGRLALTASYDVAANEVYLTGNSTFQASTGSRISSIQVSGTNNKIKGQPPLMSKNLKFADSSTRLQGVLDTDMNENIELNGGVFDLIGDIKFVSGKQIIGPGAVHCNGYQVEYGNTPFTCDTSILWEGSAQIGLYAPVTLVSTFTFTGTGGCSILGHGNIMDLSAGQIILKENVSLAFKDITLRGLNNSSFVFTNSGSTIKLSGNVTLELDDTLITGTGQVVVDGPATCVLKDKSWAFVGDSVLTVSGFTLWLEQAGASSIGDISGNITLIDDGIILQQASGNTALMTSEISALQGWVYSKQHVQRRTPTRVRARR